MCLANWDVRSLIDDRVRKVLVRHDGRLIHSLGARKTSHLPAKKTLVSSSFSKVSLKFCRRTTSDYAFHRQHNQDGQVRLLPALIVTVLAGGSGCSPAGRSQTPAQTAARSRFRISRTYFVFIPNWCKPVMVFDKQGAFAKV